MNQEKVSKGSARGTNGPVRPLDNDRHAPGAEMSAKFTKLEATRPLKYPNTAPRPAARPSPGRVRILDECHVQAAQAMLRTPKKARR